MPRSLAGLAPCLVILAAGCGGGPRPEGEIRVAAASDLQAALPVLASRFRLETGIAVEFTVGSSGQLAQQIAQGAPFDLFLAANRKFVDDLAARGEVVPSSVKPYARGSLVLAVYAEEAETIRSLDDLRRPEVRKVAIANPEFAPYGLAARQALERRGLWEELRPKVVQAETVRQALQFVQSGNAEVGLVGLAIADVPEVRAVPIDPGLYDPLIQALGVTRGARDPSKAARFAEFLLSEAGQGILSDFGFRAPSSDPSPRGQEQGDATGPETRPRPAPEPR